MIRLSNKTINEFYDRSNRRIKQHDRATNFVALIPTLLLTAWLLTLPTNWTEPNILLLPFVTLVFYVLSKMGAVVALDCWTIAEMVSPSILGKYRKIKTFFSLLMDSPTRQEFLKATKLYSEIVEKNGIETYYSFSEFVKNIYNTQDKQNHKIDETIAEVMRELKINRLAFSKEHNLRIQAERERDQTKQLNKKLTRLVVALSKIITMLRKEIKRLKGE